MSQCEGLLKRVHAKIGEVGVSEVKMDDVVIYFWSSVSDCQDGCPLHDRCVHAGIGKCEVQKEYMSNVATTIFRNYGDKIPEPILFRVGMHMIPLYTMLCQLQLQAHGIEIVNVGKNKIYIHPIMKEIRETIKILEGLWKTLDLHADWQFTVNLTKEDIEKMYKQQVTSHMKKKAKIEDGLAVGKGMSYYDRMASGDFPLLRDEEGNDDD